MADNLRNTTKVNLTDSTSTTNSTNPNNNNNSNSNNNNNNDEIAPVVLKGIDLFLGNIIIHQLLQVSNLFFQLDIQSVLSLTLTSKTLFKPLSSLISQHFTFHPKHTPLIHYHPKKLRIETFDIDGLFDNPRLSNITEIEFKKRDWKFITNHLIDKAIIGFILLSLNLTKFTFSYYFNQPINSLFHLKTLTHLEFCYNSGFNHPVDNLLPPNLTNLSLGLHFNHPVNHLPPNLFYLKLGQKFTQPINLLYLTKLTHLEFDFSSVFNHPIDNLLPLNLTKLSLGWYYNQSINHLPSKLISLELRGNFNQPISQLPPNLTKLSFSYCFNHPIENILPKSLIKLIFGPIFSHPINNFPPNITHLVLPNYTPSQYEYIQKMPSILYFNNEAMKPNSNQLSERVHPKINT